MPTWEVGAIAGSAPDELRIHLTATRPGTMMVFGHLAEHPGPLSHRHSGWNMEPGRLRLPGLRRLSTRTRGRDEGPRHRP